MVGSQCDFFCRDVDSFGNKIIYVSCSPNSLAKGLRLLINFNIKDCSLYDMFPRTIHIETLCILERI